MKKFRITKARIIEVIRQYRGKSNGLHTELRNGGIDPDLPYTQTRDKDTGDYIYTQEDAWVEPIVEPEVVKLPKAKKKGKKGK